MTTFAIADLNGDGKPDIAVAYNASAVISILYSRGDGSFQTPQAILGGSQPSFILAADMDRDGRVDLVTTNPFAGSVSLIRNGGSGNSSGPVPVPAILISNTQLQFSYNAAGPPPLPQVASIIFSSGGAVAWTAVSNVPWISMSSGGLSSSPLQASGVTPSILTVAAIPAFLSPGVYPGAISITGGGSPNTQTISVTLTITIPGPGIGPGGSPPIVTGVRNSGSYFSTTLAQGSVFVVTGINLGPTQLQKASNPLPAQLGGTSVQLFAGGNNFACPLVYTSATQISAIVPSAAPLGDARASVTVAGLISFPFSIRIVSSAVGIYSVRSSGTGPGVFTGVDFAAKTSAHPAKPGDVVIAWATGLGPIEGDDSLLPTTFKQFAGIEVFAGSQVAKVISANRSGCCSGLDQIAFEVPGGSLSCFVPVSVRTPGGSSNFVTLPVSADGGPCSNPAPQVPQSLLDKAASGQPIALGLLGVGPIPVLRGAGFRFSESFAERLSNILGRKVPQGDVDRLLRAYRTRDMAAIGKIAPKYAAMLKSANAATKKLLRAAAASEQQQGAAAQFGAATGIGAIAPDYMSNFPALGTCMVTQSIGKDPAALLDPLNAGNTLTVMGPGGPRSMSGGPNGPYQATLGPVSIPAATIPGFYTIAGTGGTDIGPFSVTLNVTDPLKWTNKSATSVIDRTQPLTITWSGGPASGHIVIGGAVNTPETAAIFICSEATQKGTFTIPQFILSALSAAQRGSLFIAPHPFDNPVSIPGLDIAFLADGSSDSQTVTFH